MISETEQKLTYPIALLLSTANRKTFEALARDIQTSGDTISRMLERTAAKTQDLIRVVSQVFKRKRIYLIIDDTLILKIYSKLIPGTSDNYDSSDGKTYRSLCSIVAMVTDGKISIPIDQAIWTSEEFAKHSYAKKWELAQALIEKIRNELPIYMVIADGLYAIVAFLKWLMEQSIKFEMRFHANRVIDDNGFKSQIKNNQRLRLSGRRPKRTIRAKWYGLIFCFTAHRRVTKYGKVNIIYQISNYKASAREHVQIYGYRWNIEKFFRTAKQKLGLNDCQSRKHNRQESHLFSVFFMYALLQIERKMLHLENVETVIKSLKSSSFEEVRLKFMRSVEIFGYA